jgi:hypothetical protein
VPDMLSYSDAVKLLGGQESKVVAALNTITGGALLGAAIPFPAVLGWFDAKEEFARLSNQLLTGLSERRTGLSRYDRTRRLEAAHAVIVVTGYFEALAAGQLPFPLADLELTKAEQFAIVGGGPGTTGDSYLIHAIFSVSRLLPGPQYPHARLVETLHDYYLEASAALLRFVKGLAVWERLAPADRERFEAVLHELPPRAYERYDALSRRLALDFPEFAYWSDTHVRRATDIRLHDLGTALTELGMVLADISTGRVPDERRASLARAYQAALRRSVVEGGDVPVGLRVPTLGDIYVTPLCRVANAGPGTRAADESWWSAQPVRDDLQEFLAGYLTSPRAVQAPLLVLGQPGSGKSVLTKVLAARLPAADFLPVRVVLRDVPATADLQDQIEYAIRGVTGERLDWPALARSAGDALPMVLLDGFDELLQATGVSQSDYLTRVAAFQRREADQGRPVVVLLTSRTSVADRVRLPEGTVAVRLEPFDAPRVDAWLRTWNTANAGYFEARGLRSLTPRIVLAHPDLAGQPLLLLMLALYDADGNALQRLNASLGQNELYERLLHSFAHREVTKHLPGLSEPDLARAVEDELRRLSLVAFAMFNRNSQWVTQADLTADLQAIYGNRPQPAAPQELRAQLGSAEIVLGRFFFVHRARAVRDDTPLETYEFLHATFGEYLVARLTLLVLRDIAARDAATTMPMAVSRIDDDLMHALLSFSVLSVRAPIVSFLLGLLAKLSGDERRALVDLVVRLLRVAHQPQPPRMFDRYQPQPLAVPGRHAAYGANLVLLAVCTAGRIRASELYGPGVADVVREWRNEALLWRSQLTGEEEFGSLVDTLAVERLFVDGRRDLVLTINRGTLASPPVDLFWTYEVPPGDPGRELPALRSSEQQLLFWQRRAHLLCRQSDDVVQHVLEPLVTELPAALSTYAKGDDGAVESVARVLLRGWLQPLGDEPARDRDRVYRECAGIVVRSGAAWDVDTRTRCAALVLNNLAVDPMVDAATVAAVVRDFTDSSDVAGTRLVRAGVVRCGLRFVGDDSFAAREIALAVSSALGSDLGLIGDDLLAVEAWLRLAEVGMLAVPPIYEMQRMLASFTQRRPDLIERLRRVRDGALSPAGADEPVAS